MTRPRRASGTTALTIACAWIRHVVDSAPDTAHSPSDTHNPGPGRPVGKAITELFSTG